VSRSGTSVDTYLDKRKNACFQQEGVYQPQILLIENDLFNVQQYFAPMPCSSVNLLSRPYISASSHFLPSINYRPIWHKYQIVGCYFKRACMAYVQSMTKSATDFANMFQL